VTATQHSCEWIADRSTRRRALVDDVAAAIAAARVDGVATYRGSIGDVYACSRGLGFNSVTSAHRADVYELRPVDAAVAPRGSMSAVYGRGALPLHTDGANLVSPPQIVVMEAVEAGRVNTRVFRVDDHCLTAADRVALDHGLFRVQAGTAVRVVSVRDSFGGFRFDPVCMRPLDRRARDVIDFFGSATERAQVHEWKRGEVLIIDNTRVLHGRDEAPAGVGRRLLRLMLREDRP
jgi:hypothetical protein